MKRVSFSFLLTIGLLHGVHSAPTASSQPNSCSNAGLIPASASCSSYPPPTVPIGASKDPFATRNGRLFQIQSKTQYFAGTNSWYLGYLQQNSDVDQKFTEMVQSQSKVPRVWGFASSSVTPLTSSVGTFYHYFNSSGQFFNFDPNTGIPRLDYVVSAAEKQGVKLVMPLLNNWNFGGISDYTSAFGCNATAFFNDNTCQAAYKNYIKLIVNRYKSSSAIFSWELANEPRCQGCHTTVITNWASTISAYIKSLDSQHLVALGDEGWLTPPSGDGSYAYQGGEGIDFAANLAIKTLDYGTFHAYPDSWGYPNSWVNTWITQHNAIGKAAGKPVVLEEYGSTLPSDQKQSVVSPWQQTVLQSTSIAYDSFWQFGDASNTNSYDNYVIMYNTTKGSDYQVLAVQHAAAMLAKQPVANQ